MSRSSIAPTPRRPARATVLALVGVGCLAVFGAGVLAAYNVLLPARTWDVPPVYVVDDRGAPSIADGDGGVSATIAAIESASAWNGAGAGALVSATPGSVAALDTADGVPMLSFDDPFNACNGNCLAATWVSSFEDRADGSVRIFDADIITNDRYDWTSESEPGACSGEFFIEAVMVHEVGHGLGLDHTDVVGATMYPSTAACDNGGASIAADDVEGILFLYSGDGPGPAPTCDLGQFGDPCASDAGCCSGKCRGKKGAMTCKR